MKRGASISDYLSPLCPNQTQCYLTNTLQVADIIEWVLAQIGYATIWQTSFSISEEFLRRLYFIEKSGHVDTIHLILDFKATQKTLRLWAFLSQVITHTYLADNHSKIILIQPKVSNTNGDVGAPARGNDTTHCAYDDCGDDDCGDVKRRQVRSTESARASEAQWAEQEYRIEPSCRSRRKTRLTIPCTGDVGAPARGNDNENNVSAANHQRETTNIKSPTCNHQHEVINVSAANQHTPPSVAIITSQNLTRGNRHESAIITTDPSVFATLYDQIQDLIQNHSVPLSELYNAQINP